MFCPSCGCNDLLPVHFSTGYVEGDLCTDCLIDLWESTRPEVEQRRREALDSEEMN
jgi:hypothetical protein